MAERRFVIQDRGFSFIGLFDMKGLFRTVQKWFRDNNYDLLESKNNEEVMEDGKQIQFELLGSKKISDYLKFEVRLLISCNNLKETEVEHGGVKHKLLKGDVRMTIDGSQVSDYENRWEGKATNYFFRIIIDKFIYKGFNDQGEGQLKKECQALENEMKSYLNMFRYKV